MGRVFPLITAVVLLVSVIGKAIWIANFTATTAQLLVVPEAVRHFLPIIVPLVELSIVALLFVPHVRRVGVWASILLLIGFTGFHVWTLMYPLQLGCSCFGLPPLTLSTRTESIIGIVLNVSLIVMNAWWLRQQSLPHSNRGGSRATHRIEERRPWWVQSH